tara:strand:+ start:93 stop:251 length:159 start_codon:yes stop_codon:yes gene_type:complete
MLGLLEQKKTCILLSPQQRAASKYKNFFTLHIKVKDNNKGKFRKENYEHILF